MSTLLARGVDGLIVAPSHKWRDETCPILRDLPVPLVVVDVLRPAGRPGRRRERGVVGRGGRPPADLGHTRIGIIAGLRGLSTSEERLRGYELAHELRRVPIDADLYADGESSCEGGRKAMLSLLDVDPKPTAVFATNNNMIIGALGALCAVGVRVPEEMAVVGFDDFPWADYFHPSLTTVAQPARAIGARAAELVLRRCDDVDAPSQVIRYPAEIMHRETCGCRGPR